MADNVEFTTYTVKTDEVGSAQVQYVKLMDGTDGGTGVIPGDATNGLDVDITRIAAGDNNIGNVDIVTMPIGGYAASANLVSGVTSAITDTTATQVIAAQGSGVIIYLTSLLVTNSDADTGTVVNITDGNAGTVMWSGYAAKEGGGFAVTFPAPLKFTANTALYCACVTTGSTTIVSAAGFKAA
jgi:hypothetical protein